MQSTLRNRGATGRVIVGHRELCPPSIHHSPGRGRGNRARGRGGDSPQHTGRRWQDWIRTQAFLPPQCALLAPALSCLSPRSWVCSLHRAGQSQGSVDARVFLDFFSLWKWFCSLLMRRATRNPVSLDHSPPPPLMHSLTRLWMQRWHWARFAFFPFTSLLSLTVP